jgi:rSAM/selenodomain-associated transferase 2
MIWVIIPTLNEEQALPDTLFQLFNLTGTYRVIVVDGGSSDRTCAIVRSHPQVELLIAPKGRATQMNAGADCARRLRAVPNDWLLFLHADTLLPEESVEKLNRMEANPGIQAGGFTHRFSGADWRLRLISTLDNYRCRRSGIIYGDQALFVRVGLFEHLGGFPQQPILEDVAFCENLIRHTKPVLLDSSVVTDARKFIKMGIWRSFARVLLIIVCVQLRLPFMPQAFFRDIR